MLVAQISEERVNEIKSLYDSKKCSKCQKVAEQICTACRSVRYCTKECQKEDWRATHKKECKALAAMRERSFNEVLFKETNCGDSISALDARQKELVRKIDEAKLNETTWDAETKKEKFAELDKMTYDLVAEQQRVQNELSAYMSEFKGEKFPSHPESHRGMRTIGKLVEGIIEWNADLAAKPGPVAKYYQQL